MDVGELVKNFEGNPWANIDYDTFNKLDNVCLWDGVSEQCYDDPDDLLEQFNNRYAGPCDGDWTEYMLSCVSKSGVYRKNYFHITEEDIEDMLERRYENYDGLFEITEFSDYFNDGKFVEEIKSINEKLSHHCYQTGYFICKINLDKQIKEFVRCI